MSIGEIPHPEEACEAAVQFPDRLEGPREDDGRRRGVESSESVRALALLQSLFDHIQQALPDRIPFRPSESAERSLREQHGQPAHRGPRQVFRAWATQDWFHAATGPARPPSRRPAPTRRPSGLLARAPSGWRNADTPHWGPPPRASWLRAARPRRVRRRAPVGSPLRAARVGGRRGDTCCVPRDSLLCRSRFYMWTPSISLVIALWTAYTKPFTAT